MSTLASGCALAVALMLMALADGTTPLANPSTVINLGGAAPNHQGAGNAMFPPSPSRNADANTPSATTPAAGPIGAVIDTNTPQLVVSVVPDASSVTTTTTTTTTTTVPRSTPSPKPRRGGRGVESLGGGTLTGSGSGSHVPKTPSTTPHRVHRIHRPHRPPVHHLVPIPKPRRPQLPKPAPQPDSVSLGVRECPTPGEKRLLQR